MSERTFLLGEYGKGEWYISESELTRRLACIADVDESLIRESIIDILLHGEGEVEELHNCKDTPKRVGNYIYCGSCRKLLVEYSNVEQDQPSPTPTRAEWEAWAKRVAISVWGDATGHIKNMTEALLSMPIVPNKERVNDHTSDERDKYLHDHSTNR